MNSLARTGNPLTILSLSDHYIDTGVTLIAGCVDLFEYNDLQAAVVLSTVGLHTDSPKRLILVSR